VILSDPPGPGAAAENKELIMNKWLRTYMSVIVVVVLIAGGAMYGPALVGRIAFAVEEGKQAAVREHLAELSKRDYLSPLFREVAKAVKPAVVEVRVTKRIKVRQMPSPEMDDFFRRFFGEESPRRLPRQPRPRYREYFSRGLGSGVIVDAEKGYVLTNHHVVGEADEVEVILADKRKFQAQWVRTDRQSDLAIVKIAPKGLLEAPLGDSDKMRVGDWVLAVGTPESLPQTVTAGIISAKGRTTRRADAYQDFLQTDAAINHGNSGGPLVNMRGEVIGINTAIVSRTGVNEGIGLAIPSNMAKNVMAQLIEKGKVVRGYLGVVIQNVDEKLAKSFDLPDTKGALVSQVAGGGPAERAGIKVGDFIVAVGDKKTRNVNELRNAVAAVKPGRTVRLELYRDGKTQTLSVKIEAQPDDMAGAFGWEEPLETASEKFGLKVATMNEELAKRYGYEEAPKGVVITAVDPQSDAAEQGLREGMVITHVRGRELASAEQFAKMVSGDAAASGVRIRIMQPDGARRFVFIAPAK